MDFGKKSKGFIFSADAAFAIILVLIVAATLLVGEKTADSSSDSFKFLDSKTRDYSIVGFYLNKTAKQLGISENPDFTASSAKCNSSYVLDLNPPSAGQTQLTQKRFCDVK